MDQPNYSCRYCRTASFVEAGAQSCPNCGAPFDVRAHVTRSGWESLPPIKDMARIQFGRSHVQITGSAVPMADFRLDPEDGLYFSHHKLLWADSAVRMGTRNDGKGVWTKMLAGMPLYMIDATGPGHLALSDNHLGEIVALPLQAGWGMWVSEHAMLAASRSIDYDYKANGLRLKLRSGNDYEYDYPLGQYDDVFYTHDQPGLLLLHSPGNTFIRDLQEHERLLVKPKALLYRDLSVQASLHVEYAATDQNAGFWSSAGYRHRDVWLRLRGPGRVAVSSKYEWDYEATTGTVVSGATENYWR